MKLTSLGLLCHGSLRDLVAETNENYLINHSCHESRSIEEGIECSVLSRTRKLQNKLKGASPREDKEEEKG